VVEDGSLRLSRRFHDTGPLVIKSELILRLAGRNPHLHQRDVAKVVDAILDDIVTALARGDRVELRGFGSFSAKIRGGRIRAKPKDRSYSPRTREENSLF
jgi:integration host factor subunit beta